MTYNALLLCRKGLALYEAGHLDEALVKYNAALFTDPRCHHAYFLLGTLHFQTGRLDLALAALKQAVDIEPSNAMYLRALGLAHHNSGHLEEAITSYDKSLSIEPGLAEAHYDRGRALLSAGRPLEALASQDKAIELKPLFAEAHNIRGIALHAQGEFEAAINDYDRAISMRPDFYNAFLNRKRALHALSYSFSPLYNAEGDKPATGCGGQTGHMSGWIASTRYIEDPSDEINQDSFRPTTSDAIIFYNRGSALYKRGQFEEAATCYKCALSLRPQFPEAYFALALVFSKSQRLEVALEYLDHAIGQSPTYADAFAFRGSLLFMSNRLSEAVESYDWAISLSPGSAAFHHNRGVAFFEAANPKQALESYDRAIVLRPDYPEAHVNRSIALTSLRRPDEAIAALEVATSLQPDYALAHLEKAAVLLRSGRFREGWAEYEWRKTISDIEIHRSADGVAWRRSDQSSGERILLYYEQGFGDTIQFFRYVEMVRELGLNCLVRVQQPLVSLFQRNYPDIRFIGKHWFGAPIMFNCAMLSLPLTFQTTPISIPVLGRNLHADHRKVLDFASELGAKTEPRVGLVWSGNPSHPSDRARSIAFAQLSSLLEAPVQWICLQENIRPSDASDFFDCGRIRFLGNRLLDFDDTAALIELMDLVITVDTSIAHLAGAMGKQVWILLPFVADWRWLVDTDRTTWYPTARLFRQPKIGDWDSVIGDVRGKLEGDLANL